MFSLPGAPVVRYGDEIGLGEDLSLQERDAVRMPLHWSDAPQAGFSAARDLVHPVLTEGPYSYRHVNVESQRRTPDSLLIWMTAIIRLRQECSELGWGKWQILETAGLPCVLAMHYHWQGSSLLTLHNCSEKAHEVVLDLKGEKESRLTDLLVDLKSEADEKGSIHYAGPLWLPLVPGG